MNQCVHDIRLIYSFHVITWVSHLCVQVIVKLIFQVYCHILYWHHDAFVEKEALTHLNTCFKWFIFFVSAMKLLDAEDAVPLQNLINRIFELENNPTADDDMTVRKRFDHWITTNNSRILLLDVAA